MAGLVALAFAYLFSQFYRSFLAVLTPELATSIGATKTHLADALGVWFVAFAAMQFFVGVGLDRYGPRRTVGWVFGICATAGVLLFAKAQAPWMITVAMGLIGMGCAPVLLGTLLIFARRFEARQFAIMTSWFVAVGNLGNVIGAAPMANAVEIFGWRTAMLVLAVTTLAVAVAVLLLVKDPEHDQTTSDGMRGYITLLKMPVLWPILVMGLLCYAPVAGIRGLWTGPYLNDLHAADTLLIGKVTFWMAIAIIVGSFAYGPLDKIFNTRKRVVLIGNLCVLVLLLFFVFFPDMPLGLAAALFIGFGLFGTSYAVVMAHCRAFLPPALVGRGVTLLNFCSICGVGIMQFATGQVISSQSDQSSPQTYQLIFGTYAIVLAITIVVYLFSRDAPPEESSHADSSAP